MMTPAIALMLSLTAHPPSAVAKPAAVELSGKVREVGGGPAGRAQAMLVDDTGTEWTLYTTSDELNVELRRLSGVVILVTGLKNDPRIPTGRHVMVEHYRILDVGKGVVPRVGRLASLELDGATRLLFVDDLGQADLLPEGWGRKMMRHVGAKLWMVGERKPTGFRPARFSLLGGPPSAGDDTAEP